MGKIGHALNHPGLRISGPYTRFNPITLHAGSVQPKILGIFKGSRKLEEEGRYQEESKGTLTQD